MPLTQVQGGMLAGSTNTTTTIQSNGTTAITIDSSQNVGIGTTGPSAKLMAVQSNPTRGIIARFNNSGSSSQTGAQIQLSQAGIQDWAFGQPAGVDAFADIVKFFQKDFTILVITHNDRLKDKFTNGILVEQDINMISRAKVVSSW